VRRRWVELGVLKGSVPVEGASLSESIITSTYSPAWSPGSRSGRASTARSGSWRRGSPGPAGIRAQNPEARPKKIKKSLRAYRAFGLIAAKA
jgi:hypothetical protein